MSFKYGSEFHGYLIEKQLGSGTFLVRNKIDFEDVLAMKVLKIGSLELESYKSGLEIGMEISQNSRYLVNMKNYYIEGENCILLMEYCDGGNLEQYLKTKKTLTNEELLILIYDIMNGIKELHDGNSIHRNLNMSSIFITSGRRYKLGDYLTVRNIDRLDQTTAVGSNGFIAPEIVTGEKYSKESDIFSMGSIIYESLIGRNPFANNNRIDTVKMVHAEYEKMTGMKGIDEEIAVLCDWMLKKEAEKRPNVNDVLNKTILKKIKKEDLEIEKEKYKKLKEKMKEQQEEIKKLKNENRKEKEKNQNYERLTEEKIKELKNENRKEKEEKESYKRLTESQQEEIIKLKNENIKEKEENQDYRRLKEEEIKKLKNENRKEKEKNQNYERLTEEEIKELKNENIKEKEEKEKYKKLTEIQKEEIIKLKNENIKEKEEKEKMMKSTENSYKSFKMQKQSTDQVIKFPISFLPPSSESEIFIEKKRITFLRDRGSTLFLDREIVSGIVKIDLKIIKLKGQFDYAPEIGITLKHLLTLTDTMWISKFDISGVLRIGKTQINVLLNKKPEGIVHIAGKDDDVVSMELNMYTRKLHWFLNHSLVSHCITNVPQGAYFGISGAGGHVYEVVSFLSLPFSSVNSSLPCVEH